MLFIASIERLFMQRRRSQKPEWQLKIAQERIEILFKMAKEEFENHPERAKRYVELARKIGLRYNIRLSEEVKRSFCKRCNALLYLGKNTEELEKKHPNIKLFKCLNCGEIKKIAK
jgi:ribonuclease P protein subunit RPR2